MVGRIQYRINVWHSACRSPSINPNFKETSKEAKQANRTDILNANNGAPFSCSVVAFWLIGIALQIPIIVQNPYSFL